MEPIELWDVEDSTDGGEVVSLTLRLFTPQKDSCYSFLLEAESIPGS
jgi:hypothetical protein